MFIYISRIIILASIGFEMEYINRLNKYQGSSTPHSHIEKYIGLPVLFKASLIGGYLTFGDVPSVLQLSYLR